MTALRTTRRFLVFLALASAAPVVAAHGGEDHGVPATPAAVAPADAGGPRASAATDTFEAVAVLHAGTLRIFVDRYDSNEPVIGAAVDVEGAGVRGRAAETAPGVYALPVAALAPGAHALALTVEAGDAADLLALSLVVPPAEALAAPGGNGYAALVAAALAILLAGGFAAWRIAARRREARA